MKIGFDIDGVLADFNAGFIDKVIQVTGEDKFPPRPFDIPVWNYPEHYGYTTEQVAAVWEDLKADRLFWLSLQPYAGLDELGAALTGWEDTSKHDIYFITSRPGVRSKNQTEGWLRLHGFAIFPTVLISSQKGLACKALNLDLYVDDYRKNCDDVHFNSDTRVFIKDQPWNRDGVDSYSRVTSLYDFLARVN